MSAALSVSTRLFLLIVLLALFHAPCSFSATTWNGVLRDAAGKPVTDAKITLRGSSGDRTYEVRTTASGTFVFAGIETGTYTLVAEVAGKT
jgi:hypothetical protein